MYRGDGASAPAKHHKFTHSNIKFNNKEEVANLYIAKVIKPSMKFKMQRYVAESIYIEQYNNDPHIELINSRSEWGNNRVRRLRNG